MAGNLLEVETLLRESRVEEAVALLKEILVEDDKNGEAWYLLGGVYRRQQLWGDAINALNKAKMLDPEGPAATAIESIYSVLSFMNKDLMNP